MTARLASAVFVSALIREVHARGGSAMVLAQGDPTAGALLLLCADKGRITGAYEYVLAPSGDYVWAATGAQDIGNPQSVDALCARRRRIDPDLWIVELDVAYAERLIVELSGRD